MNPLQSQPLDHNSPAPIQSPWYVCRYQQGIRDRAATRIDGGEIIRVEAHPIPEHPRPWRVKDWRWTQPFPQMSSSHLGLVACVFQCFLAKDSH